MKFGKKNPKSNRITFAMRIDRVTTSVRGVNGIAASSRAPIKYTIKATIKILPFNFISGSSELKDSFPNSKPEIKNITTFKSKYIITPIL